MSRFKATRPSPATVIATISLFVSLGGVGYAAATIGSSQIRNNAVQSKDIRNRTIVGKDISSKTITALKGRRGPAGAQGLQGAKGDTGAAGSAKAFATVNTNATFLTTTTPAKTAVKGFTAVARPAGVPTGVYCLTPAAGVDVFNASPIGSPEWYESSGFDLLVEPLSQPDDCPAGTLEVRTYDFPGGVPALSNDVAFSVLIP